MSRGNLLMVAERAIEIVPKAKLRALVGGMVRLDEVVERRRGAEVDRAIRDFADYQRPKLLAAARRMGNAEQKAALRRLPARERRR